MAVNIQSQRALGGVYQKLDDMTDRTATAMDDLINVTNAMQTASEKDMQKLQAKLTQIQQRLELLKQIQEKLEKCANVINQAPQPR